MHITLTAIETPLFDAFQVAAAKLPNVSVYHGSIFDARLNRTAVVSPANSFGFMDGGIDAEYVRVFGDQVELRLRREIRRKPFNELPVGEAIPVRTDHERLWCLIAAPTMRVPMRLPVDTVNPYLAARAAIRCAIAMKFDSLAFPGMGTGVGGVSPEVCARQVCAAIYEQRVAIPDFPSSWREASARHQGLYLRSGVEIRDLQDGGPMSQ